MLTGGNGLALTKIRQGGHAADSGQIHCRPKLRRRRGVAPLDQADLENNDCLQSILWPLGRHQSKCLRTPYDIP